MGNSFAYAALVMAPAIIFLLFLRLSRVEAIIWSILGAYLLLPVRTVIDLPMLPALEKDITPALTAFLLCALGVGAARSAGLRRAKTVSAVVPAQLAGWLPKSWLVRTMLAGMIIGPMITVFTNSDPILVGGRFIPGLRVYDGLSSFMNNWIYALPLLMGRRYLSEVDQHRTLLRVFIIATAAYSVLMLIEIQISPQLHRMVYGYFPHMFAQSVRFGGYRPMVFLGHGLLIALLTGMALIAAATMWRATASSAATSLTKGRYALATVSFAVMLVLNKSIGAIVTGFGAVCVVLLAGKRTQMTIAALIAVSVLFYPILRGGGFVPTASILQIADTVNKAGSLGVRFSNEDALLEKAEQRLLFGWGGWGRSRVYDDESGRDVSITDGAWIIIIGGQGWIGYLSRFGLLCLPILFLWRARKADDFPMETAGLCMVMAMNLADLIPNAGLRPITWLIAGALLGAAERRATMAAVLPRDRARGHRPIREGVAPPSANDAKTPVLPSLGRGVSTLPKPGSKMRSMDPVRSTGPYRSTRKN